MNDQFVEPPRPRPGAQLLRHERPRGRRERQLLPAVQLGRRVQLLEPPRDAPRGSDHRVPVRREPELHVRPDVRKVRRLRRLHLPLRRLRRRRRRRDLDASDRGHRSRQPHLRLEDRRSRSTSASVSASSSTAGSPSSSRFATTSTSSSSRTRSVARTATRSAQTPQGHRTATSTWFGESRLTNTVQAQVGISIFLPFSWEYRLPK